MKIALYSDDPARLERVRRHMRLLRKKGGSFKEDYFLLEKEFFKALEENHYDMILIISGSDSFSRKGFLRKIRRAEGKSMIIFVCGRRRGLKSLFKTKYTAHFNGRSIVMDMEDIYYLESYNRKTSIVRERDRLRINARLDVEERKFSVYQFARINQGSIVNLHFIHALEGDKVRMKNGEILYISSSRRKAFIDKYTEYLAENFHFL